MKKGFSNTKYFNAQVKAFRERLETKEGPTFVEFGGKPFDDQHAERVLPGYDRHIKAKLLTELNIIAKIVIAVNSRDIFSPPYGRYRKKRIRGDSGLWYDDETIRLILKGREFGFNIEAVVVTCLEHKLKSQPKKELAIFKKKLDEIGAELKLHYAIANYPEVNRPYDAYRVYEKNDRLVENENLIVFSPGGGSGKFGVILSEIYRSLRDNLKPNFVKFETFPVFTLDADHPLNLAFEAATADLDNKVKNTKHGTNYNKDIENFKIMQRLVQDLDGDSPLAQMKSPIDWGVNQIHKGIVDMKAVKEACYREVLRRIERYKKENEHGIEKKPTVNRAKAILLRF